MFSYILGLTLLRPAGFNTVHTVDYSPSSKQFVRPQEHTHGQKLRNNNVQNLHKSSTF